eukprot:scaffold67479_cov53-Phaeocystis_antarctica.AAC.2
MARHARTAGVNGHSGSQGYTAQPEMQRSLFDKLLQDRTPGTVGEKRNHPTTIGDWDICISDA